MQHMLKKVFGNINLRYTSADHENIKTMMSGFAAVICLVVTASIAYNAGIMPVENSSNPQMDILIAIFFAVYAVSILAFPWFRIFKTSRYFFIIATVSSVELLNLTHGADHSVYNNIFVLLALWGGLFLGTIELVFMLATITISLFINLYAAHGFLIPELDFLTTLAVVLAAAVVSTNLIRSTYASIRDQKTLVSELEDQTKSVTAYNEIISNLRGVRRLPDVFRTVISEAGIILDAHATMIFLKEGDTLLLHESSKKQHVNDSDIKLHEMSDGCDLCTALTTKAAVFMTEENSENGFLSIPYAEEYEIRAAVIAPLLRDDQLYGALVFGYDHHTTLSESEMRLINFFADEVSQAILIAQNYESLRDLKQSYQNIVENASDVIVSFDLGGQIMVANARAGEVTGISFSKLIGRSVWDFVRPGEQSSVKDFAQKVIYGIEEAPREIHVLDQTGRELLLEVSAVQLVEKEKVVGVIMIGRDITAKRQLVDEVVKHNKKLISLNKISAVLGGISDPENSYQKMLLAVVGTLGYDLGALLMTDQHFREIEAKAYFGVKEPWVLSLGHKFFEAREARGFITRDEIKIFTGEDLSTNLELRIDNSCMTATFIFVPLHAKSLLVGALMLGVYKTLKEDDIDLDLMRNIGNQFGVHVEMMDLLNELRASERRYHQVMEYSVDGIFIIDVMGNYKDVNLKAVEMLGYTKDELLKMNIRQLVDPSSIDSVYPSLLERGTGHGEITLLRKDGTSFLADLSATSLEIGGQRHFLGVARDITHKREVEHLIKRENAQLKLLNEIFAASTHSVDIDKMLPVISAKVIEFFGVDALGVYLFDESTNALNMRFGQGYAVENLREIQEMPVKNTILGQVFLTGEPSFIEEDLMDSAQLSDWSKRVLNGSGLESLYTMPLTSFMRTIGVIQLGAKTANKIDEFGREVLLILCNQIGIVVENGLIFETEHRKNEQLEAIDRITRAASSSLNLNEILRRVLDRLIDLVGADFGAVLLKDSTSKKLRVKLGQGLSEEVYVALEAQIGQSIAGIAFKTGDILVADNMNAYDSGQYANVNLKFQVAIPLISGTNPIGVIYMASKAAQRLNASMKSTLKQLSDNLAVMVHNTMLFNDQKGMAEKLKLFNKISGDIGTSLDLKLICQQVVQSLSSNLKVGCSHIWILKPCDKNNSCSVRNICPDRTSCLHLQAQGGDSCASQQVTERVPLGKFDVGIAAQSGRVIVNNEPASNPLSLDHEWIMHEKFESFAAYPIVVDKKVVGVLDVYNKFPLDKELNEVLLSVAKDVSSSFKNAELYSQLNMQKTKVDTLLRDLADGVVISSPEMSILTLNRGAERMLGHASEEVKISKCYEVFKGLNDEGHAICKRDCFAMRQLEQGAEMVNFDMQVADKKGRKRWLRTTMSATKDITGQIQDYIHVFQDVTESKELEVLALVDELTKLKNRRYLMARLREELAGVKRNKYSLSCAMIDIDKFKSVNDTYGHSIGDEVLKAVSRTIEEVARTTDIVARYGGEEFCVLLPHTALDGARIFAEKLRSQVERNVLYLDQFEIRPTISIGLAVMDEHSSFTGKKLIEEADKALYEAKETGRNKVCWRAPEEKKVKGS